MADESFSTAEDVDKVVLVAQSISKSKKQADL